MAEHAEAKLLQSYAVLIYLQIWDTHQPEIFVFAAQDSWKEQEWDGCVLFFFIYLFLSSLHAHHGAQCRALTHDTEIKTWAELKGQNRLS